RGGAEKQCREECCTRNPDLLISFCDAALKGRDIGTPLQELRWQTNGHDRRLCVEGRRRKTQVRGRFAGQHGDRVLELSALNTDVGVLRLCGGELRLCLRHVGARSSAALVAARRELQRV